MISKNDSIKNSLKLTKDRRKNQVCKVFQFKIQSNKLSKTTKYYLNRLFLEAKWYENSVIQNIPSNLNDSYAKSKVINIKYLDSYEARHLFLLSSQMKQSINDKIKSNLQTLSKLKKNHKKVGKLKFRKSVHSIDLKQFGRTYKIINNKLLLQSFPNILPLIGIEQLDSLKDVELANAKLIRQTDGYYLKVTTYSQKQELINQIIGIDMGIKEQITLSNGISFKYKVPETKKLKKLQRRLSKKKVKSKNFYKCLDKVKKEYKKISNQRDNINNHIYGYLKQFKTICMQDEMIKSWHKIRLFGKTIQYSGIGKLKAKLKNLDTSCVLDKSVPTTKTCIYCGYTYKISLKEREYHCPQCQKKYDRDIGSAINMILFSYEKDLVPMDNIDREFKPVERQTSVLSKWNKNYYLNISYTSMKQEASLFRVE